MTTSSSAAYLGFSTRAIHAGQAPEPHSGAVVPPIFTSSTFVHDAPGVHRGHEYSRCSNPTRKAFEDCLASLEGGSHAFAFASGMAAEACSLALLDSGSHIVAVDDLYGGTVRLFEQLYGAKMNLTFSYVPASDLDALEKALRPETALIWIETPSNPLLKIADLAAIADIAKKRQILTLADNTFCSPALQRPLEMGIDLVLHSVTKFINGHSDMIGGALIVQESALAEKIEFILHSVGSGLAPFDAYLALRGLKTLSLRMERHSQNALALAEWLQDQSGLSRVYYPGLANHPGHGVASRQMTGGFGGMLTIDLDSDMDGVLRFLEGLSVFTLAESLGGVESLISHPCRMTHAALSPERQAELGLSEGTLRLSVGLEDKADLIADLQQGLARL